jgi:uncharacterized protein YidB (DUF937 family)
MDSNHWSPVGDISFFETPVRAFGPNKPVTPPQLEQAIGSEVLEVLSKQTGLSREELLARLSREPPDAVDKYTPQGRLPTETDFPRS